MPIDGLSSIVNFLRCYGWLIIVAAALAVFNTVYFVSGIIPTSRIELISSYTLPFCFAIWVVMDARSRRCTPCFDFGMFVLATWVLSVPGYLIWTRRWRGLLVTMMFFGLLFMSQAIALFVWAVVVVVAQ